MYIVLTAMLALNVSSDVLNGFSQVQTGLQRTSKNMTEKNRAHFRYLEDLYRENPDVVEPWFEQGVKVKEQTDALFKDIEQLKIEIAKQADGPNADYMKLVNRDDLEASGVTMLDPITQKGKKLRERIDLYREFMISLIDDPEKKKAVAGMLSTVVYDENGNATKTPWEISNFENMPAIAAITYLTHLQNNLRQSESDAISSVISSISYGENGLDDIIPPGSMVANELSAFVIPRTTMLMQGGQYEADIVLAAVDTTNRPRVYVGGREIRGGKYTFSASGIGEHEYSGYIEVFKHDGTLGKFPFKSSYTVMEPMVTISPTMMNVLYAGIDNPISISAPGIPMSSINATISNGTLTRNGNSWIARSSGVGQEATISVTANMNGGTTNLGSMTFRVRKLPDPLAYIPIKDGSGNTLQYKGAPRRISKAQLMSATGVGAALDDGVLDIQYQVVSFQTIVFDQMGNAIPENSAGSQFSARQKDQFKNLKPGKTFIIGNIKAKGPDGITRDVPPIQVSLN
ncbi:MAG: gliding motility protein GldM [Lachnospiraceae bacterium]|nr:gliding motility protein GldM [Lachnospiraceae bacterium]